MSADGLNEHPALAAWRRLGFRARPPVDITVLKEESKASVYALHGVGPGSCTVVAKRSASTRALVEKTLYEQVLPQLSLPGLEYYGFVEEEGQGWLFIGYASGATYSPLLGPHRVMAARWLGLLHRSAAHLRPPAALPAKEPEHYLGLLRSAREFIEQGSSNPALTRGDREVLDSVMRQLDDLQAGWSRVEVLCGTALRTLVHGDFASKNMVVSGGASGGLRVFDWGTSGWGIPAADLAQNGPGETYWVSPDLAVYRDIIRGTWSSLDVGDLRMLAEVGKIFRSLAALRGDASALATPWVQGAMERLPLYRVHLRAGMAAVGLTFTRSPVRFVLEGGR